MMILRHLLSILLLPFMVVVVIPTWILASRGDTDTRWIADSAEVWAARSVGIALFLVGFSLFAWCVWLFARVGEGTLAPWDPTRRLVARGPYRYMRNPMITGVLTMLLGEALIPGSRSLAMWALTFFIINCIYFVVLEEPGLERRFGDSYRRYKAAVPRWLPRSTPWDGKEMQRGAPRDR